MDSGTTYSRSGNYSQRQISETVIRWGGGADPGCYHLFLCGHDLRRFGVTGISIQCVVDDFGDLVAVQ